MRSPLCRPLRWARIGVCLGLLGLPAAAYGQSADHRQLQSLTAAAQTAYNSGDLAGALRLANRVADEAGRRFGANDLRTAQALNNLALFQDLSGALDAAGANYRRAISILDALPERHAPLLADLKNNLAAVVLQQCRMAEARGLYADALKLTEARFGSYHPETDIVRANVERLDRFAAGKASAKQAAELGQLFRLCMS